MIVIMMIKESFCLSISCLLSICFFSACNFGEKAESPNLLSSTVIKPIVTTDTTLTDTDDPAIWINYLNKDSSLIIGTDKDNLNGGYF